MILLLAAIGCAANSDPNDSGDAGLPDATLPDASPPPICNEDFDSFRDEFRRDVICVFVAPDGDDGEGDGSAASPFQTISKGIEFAAEQTASLSRIHVVAVSRGTYDERISVQNGVSVYGQFDRGDSWNRAPDHETTVTNATVQDQRIEGIFAVGINAPTLVDGFTVIAGPATSASPGADVYGVRVLDSRPAMAETPGLELHNLIVRAAAAASGDSGADEVSVKTGFWRQRRQWHWITGPRHLVEPVPYQLWAQKPNRRAVVREASEAATAHSAVGHTERTPPQASLRRGPWVSLRPRRGCM